MSIDEADHWHPPPPTVSFIVTTRTSLFRRRTRYISYVNTVSIWAMTEQRRFRGWTEAEALAKAQAHARKLWPDEMANTPDPPRVHRLG